ncbi:hypothetical protein FO519_001456 [Halicephalobus sp. NKZ332]|nr:hypothetical protein FO519_001456 [Halicephalobus sp. NKZ332]
MKLLMFLALVGLTTAAVYKHSLTWRESKRSKLMKSNDYILGVYTYGAVDTQNCGDVIAYHKLLGYLLPIQDTQDWSRVLHVSCWLEAISDTGTSFIGGPQDVIDSLANAVGATYDYDYSAYLIDCKADFPSLTLTIGNETYHVDKKQLN